MEDDPIREPETFLDFIKKHLKVKKKHKVHITTSNPYWTQTNDMTHIFDGCRRINQIPAIEIDNKTLAHFGMTTEEACERLLKFSKILTPNEMRELIERRKQW